jgi:N-acetyl-gamma-glutamyl-phosphate reductase
LKIRAGIVGATGYAGSELTRILSRHPNIGEIALYGRSAAGKHYGCVYQNFSHTNLCVEDGEEIHDCDVLFLCLPHGIASKTVTNEMLDKTKVIDLGADFRLSDWRVYEQWYAVEHYAKDILPEAVYGLSEINRGKIKDARLVANPGCYTTAAITALYPLLKHKLIDKDSIVIDAKSGVSGAGRGVSGDVLYCELNENIKPYKIGGEHRHTPEIEQALSFAYGENVTVTFTPHLVPMNRGILATSYAKLEHGVGAADIKSAYHSFYGEEYFIRLTHDNCMPQTKWVKGSNFVDIGFAVDERTNRVVAISALDNLIKGAAGQATQNMNIMFGFNEKAGIDFIPAFPV